MPSSSLRVSRPGRAVYGARASTSVLSASSNITWVVSTRASVKCTIAWMWMVRPWYQPGQMVVNSTMPSALVTWAPRRYRASSTGFRSAEPSGGAPAEPAARIGAGRVAVPDLHHGLGQRLARLAVLDLDRDA